MTRYNIRMAKDGEGPAIEALLRGGGWDLEGLDWSRVGPGWLVAEDPAGLVGCLQVLPGQPIGTLERMATRTDLTPIERAGAVHALATQGMATLLRMGAGMVMITVPHENKAWKRILKKRGAVTVSAGALLAKGLS